MKLTKTFRGWTAETIIDLPNGKKMVYTTDKSGGKIATDIQECESIKYINNTDKMLVFSIEKNFHKLVVHVENAINKPLKHQIVNFHSQILNGL